MLPADEVLSPGDLILVELAPVRGTEQDGRRPALVGSMAEMHALTRRAFVCPITRNRQPWPTKVLLPEGLAAEGAVLTDQPRSIDREERVVRKLGTAPDAVVAEVRAKIAALLGIDMDLQDVRRG